VRQLYPYHTCDIDRNVAIVLDSRSKQAAISYRMSRRCGYDICNHICSQDPLYHRACDDDANEEFQLL
jgi:hypothetical protein